MLDDLRLLRNLLLETHDALQEHQDLCVRVRMMHDGEAVHAPDAAGMEQCMRTDIGMYCHARALCACVACVRCVVCVWTVWTKGE